MSKQLVITPDCPRCHGPLWAIPCSAPGGSCDGDHYECVDCRLEWVYRPAERAWFRFDRAGRILERIPPAPTLFGDRNRWKAKQ